MALPVANLTQDAIEALYAVFADDKTIVGSRKGVSLINELSGILNRTYRLHVVADIDITDATDAGVSEFIGGGEGDDLAVGGIFRTIGGTADLTDNALASAKGSAVASNDVFVIDGADSVEYLGSQPVDIAVRPFDFAGETDSDFVSIGS